MGSAPKNPVAIQFGENLRGCRLGQVNRRRSLAFEAGVHRTEISQPERGERAAEATSGPDRAVHRNGEHIHFIP